MQRWRLIDSGMRPAVQQVALTRTVLEARSSHEASATLRFFRIPHSVVIGAHECVAQVVDLDACTSAGVPVVRGMFNCHAFECDPGYLAWEMHLDESDVHASLKSAFRRAAEAVTSGIASIGADVALTVRHDIRQGQRIVGWMSSLTDETAGVLQGWIAVRRPESPSDLLRSPFTSDTDGIDRRRADLSTVMGRNLQFVTVRNTIVEALETEFNVEFGEEDLTLAEDRRCGSAQKSIEDMTWTDLVRGAPSDMPIVTARLQSCACDRRLSIMLDRPAGRIRCASFALPDDQRIADALIAIESVLVDIPVDRIEHRLENHASSALRLVGISPLALADAIRKALGRIPLPRE